MGSQSTARRRRYVGADVMRALLVAVASASSLGLLFEMIPPVG